MRLRSLLIILALLGAFTATATAEPPSLKELMARIRKDTANRPPIDSYSGVRNWTHEDIAELKLEGGSLVSATNWFPKEENREPARRMCNYLASHGFKNVTVVGRDGRVLATCRPLR